MGKIRLTFPEKLLLVTTGVGLIHHLDHVLRVDHSGWPFLSRVTPFTYSLLVYPVILVVLLARGRAWLRVALAVPLFLFPTLSHIFLETPLDQYETWAHCPDVNMLDVSSPVVGLIAAAISVLLSLLALAVLLAFVREAREKGEGGVILA